MRDVYRAWLLDPLAAAARRRRQHGVGLHGSRLECVEEGDEVGPLPVREDEAQVNLIMADHVP